MKKIKNVIGKQNIFSDGCVYASVDKNLESVKTILSIWFKEVLCDA